ncbi:MAG: serine/threonine-protein phosphatase [Acidobacteria bacterium]|nr:MAG: serine/threonine-protein phosphatase [Acidobacteriota bacterium]
MSTPPKADSQQSRFAAFTEKFEAQVTGAFAGRKPGTITSVSQSLYHLFTKDVTQEGLRDLFARDPKAAFRFFTRNIDFKALESLPWYRRYPEIASRIFIALAYQLSPPRRIAFALACFCFLLGLIPRVSYQAGREDGTRISISTAAANPFWLASVLILGFLLLMELRDKLGLKADLEIAREIQAGLVASGLYERTGFRICCRMRPANTVGGDYCDFIDLGSPDRFALVIGDVAGKGMPAALLMALLQGSLRTLISAGHRGADLIAKLNAYLCGSIPGNTFVTLFYTELDCTTGELLYVNAGHNAPFLLRSDRRMERLASTSMVLGVLEDPGYSAERVCLGTWDHLLLFTDGIPEAANLKEQEYSEERLAQFLQNCAGLDQGLFFDRLVRDVIRHCGDNRPHDDMTVISIVRTPISSEAGTVIIPPPIPVETA